MTTPVNKLVPTPIASVSANPLTIPNCGKNSQFNGLKRIKATVNVVILASLIASIARPKPSLTEISKLLPFLCSSLILSKIKILESTAIPIDKINPATPGKVNTKGIALKINNEINP